MKIKGRTPILWWAIVITLLFLHSFGVASQRMALTGGAVESGMTATVLSSSDDETIIEFQFHGFW
jgi:hypothetical protein